ncbi:hypothetical protein SB861_62000, partial [Paraburkholderia sp. SIMBA_049]
ALYLSDPQQLCHYAGKWDQPSSYTRQLRYVLHADGLLTGFKCCFTAALTAGTVLDISGTPGARAAPTRRGSRRARDAAGAPSRPAPHR